MNPDELTVECPRCGAAVGRMCRLPSGSPCAAHAARRRELARAQRRDAEAPVEPALVAARPLETLILALELSVEASDACAELLEEAAAAIEDAAVRCDGGEYWLDDHVVGAERGPCPSCLALAGRLRTRAGALRTGAA